MRLFRLRVWFGRVLVWLLTLLYLLLLRGVFLFQLLRLLRVALLHLLFLRVVGVFPGSLLMFLILLLLQFLVVLILFDDEFVLLVLVSFVGGGVAGIGWR